MEKRDLEIGDVLQLKPDLSRFGGMLFVVSEPKSWGAQGCLFTDIGFDEGVCKFKNRAYFRASFEDMEYIGKIVWFREFPEIEGDE